MVLTANKKSNDVGHRTSTQSSLGRTQTSLNIGGTLFMQPWKWMTVKNMLMKIISPS